MKPIRLLTAREIECRVSQIARNGKAVSLLLYKDARCDMAILDETYGPMNWQRRHTRDNANCIVSIWDDEKKQWVEKEDTGTESNTEAEKGLASDSFKRACFNVGIGRELYTAPQIWVSPPNCEIKEDGGRFKCYDRFEVQEIEYNEHREICRLVIINSKTHNVAFEFGKTSPDGQKGPSKPSKPSDDKIVDEKPKTSRRGNSGVSTTGSNQKATEDQKKWLKDNASDDDYMDLMKEFGPDFENMTANDASREIQRIEAEKKGEAAPMCERCGKLITGIALPDGTLMTGSDLVGKSKLTYGGIYCYDCMKILNSKRKAG